MSFIDMLYGLAAIVLLDLVLAGDNAIVIALAARNLPPALQRKAVFWGTFGAIAVRVVLTIGVVYLLKLPGLMLAGGLLLLPIALKLLKPEDHDREVDPAAGLWSALRTIIVADALMGMDNVLAIAGASKGHLLLVVAGLLISVPLVVWGSTLILVLLRRYPVIVYIGAGAIAWTSARMIAHEHWLGLAGWFERRAWAAHAFGVLLVFLVCGLGYLRERRHRRIAGGAGS
ncbi:integral membrane protein [Aerosticca soli]|uniref:Integral membrane protein n=2 Tax=Aerosticca soli TaxID=2010829 RepID=A0A2Z6E721_9GAMM|nr:integral membrane protein [Aerosticca soli]